MYVKKARVILAYIKTDKFAFVKLSSPNIC